MSVSRLGVWEFRETKTCLTSKGFSLKKKRGEKTLQTHGNRWKWQRLETKIRSDSERSVVGGCWERDRHPSGPLLPPERRQWNTCQLRWCEASAREPREDGALQIQLLPTAFFAYYYCLHLLLVTAGEEAMLPLRTGSSGSRGLLAFLYKWCWTTPSFHTRKATVNHRSLTGCFSLSVCFTFFDLWTMKCFPEEYVPFEMHILKVLYSINGLVFPSHLSQTP